MFAVIDVFGKFCGFSAFYLLFVSNASMQCRHEIFNTQMACRSVPSKRMAIDYWKDLE